LDALLHCTILSGRLSDNVFGRWKHAAATARAWTRQHTIHLDPFGDRPPLGTRGASAQAPIREITRRAKGVSIKTKMEELAWRGYFGFCQARQKLTALTLGPNRTYRSA
jgi:hypothetical protein